MKAFIFPGQASQFPGMGFDLYENNPDAKYLFEEANDILGFRISDVMFGGSEDDLKQTNITQPSVFIHSVVKAVSLGDKFCPSAVAGHSLGEFSALTAAGALSFKDGLLLVKTRADAMQQACEKEPSTMAAILGLQDDIVEKICENIDEIVVAANYNSPGQIVISGSLKGIDLAIEELKKVGAKRAIKLAVGGAFHSPLMHSAKEKLEEAIKTTKFNDPICPIYQNVDAKPSKDKEIIKQNLILQLTSPVLWSQTIQNIMKDGINTFIEIGPGNVLSGLVKKINKDAIIELL